MSWRTTESGIVLRAPVFSIRRDRKERTSHPNRSHDFYVLEAVDWVNVVPVTEAGEIVLIRIYRHGVDDESLEIPGGMIDPEDGTPEEAAAREMEEETGYRSDDLELLGTVHPNPAIQANRCHSFVARNARRAGEPRPDETEDIEVVRHAPRDVLRLVEEGSITHSLVVVGLLQYFWKEGLLS